MVKCFEFGSVENVAVAIAVEVNDEGTREILGVKYSPQRMRLPECVGVHTSH